MSENKEKPKRIYSSVAYFFPKLVVFIGMMGLFIWSQFIKGEKPLIFWIIFAVILVVFLVLMLFSYKNKIFGRSKKNESNNNETKE